MAKNRLNLRKVLLLGSGALKIGEAGEFDYSGSQAAKALKEEGIEIILINPNIATIQTSNEFVNKVYFLPVTPYFVEKIIAKERPQGILLGFGGQTALNCGLALYHKGVFKKYNVKVLGTPVSAIERSEDRLIFREFILGLGLKVPGSSVFNKIQEVEKTGKSLTYPVLVRSGYSLGGLGSGVARNYKELLQLARNSLSVTPQILVEEYLEHWKELEYEVVRDAKNNTITVCNMENFDPMGIHTGESIVVAPSQTLTNTEYHFLREIAILVVRQLPIIGECNIQFALNPKNGDYRIIEVNARLSRSSALASKATGYPLAYVAAKLALGFCLQDIKNQVTKATTAFFEPALDYVVVKIPRWDFLKFKTSSETIGSEMQSVGEVMAIGRSFEEALQKAVRSLDLNYEGVISDDLDKTKILEQKKNRHQFKTLSPNPDRLFNISSNLYWGQSIDYISHKTGINKWFIQRIAAIVSLYKQMLRISSNNFPSKELLSTVKKAGFSDMQIGEIFGKSDKEIRELRKKFAILPKVCSIDTLAGEFPAKTNYLYLSYLRLEHDIKAGDTGQVGILGGGPYQVGSSVEFDWCAVNSVMTAKKLGYHTIMINNNPETVSTDYDISDKLYFEELTYERIMDIVDLEKCPLIVSMGGQIPNTLVPKLFKTGVKLLGTSAKNIENAESRNKFSRLLDRLNIEQPQWQRVVNEKDALKFAKWAGYPVLLRPSFVLSGRAMFEAYNEKETKNYFAANKEIINPDHPLVISQFIKGVKEIDFDAVAKNGKIKVWAISEHVEHAGVHSGDATLILPAFSLTREGKKKVIASAKKISRALLVNGPFNIQFLAAEYENKPPKVMVIEANLRASRSFPFVSKTTGINFIRIATRIILGRETPTFKEKKLDFYAVKAPRFSFTRLRSVDPVLRVEMASTGEVASFGDSLLEAYLKAILSTGTKYPNKSVLLSLGGMVIKKRFLPAANILKSLGFAIYTTEKTRKFLEENGIKTRFVYKAHQKKYPSVIDVIRDKKVSLVINISERSHLNMQSFKNAVTDGFLIRRAAVDAKIPLFTKASIASLFVRSLEKHNLDSLKIKSWDEYVKNIN